MLKRILDDLDSLSVKRGECYLKLIDLEIVVTIGEVDDTQIILNLVFVTKKQFEETMEILKINISGKIQ